MNQEDLKNLTGWLQAIYKESQESRAGINEMRRHVQMIPEIRDSTHRGTQDSGDAERKIENTRDRLEHRIVKMEDTLNDLRSMIKDVQSKIDRLK